MHGGTSGRTILTGPDRSEFISSRRSDLASSDLQGGTVSGCSTAENPRQKTHLCPLSSRSSRWQPRIPRDACLCVGTPPLGQPLGVRREGWTCASAIRSSSSSDKR